MTLLGNRGVKDESWKAWKDDRTMAVRERRRSFPGAFAPGEVDRLFRTLQKIRRCPSTVVLGCNRPPRWGLICPVRWCLPRTAII